MIRFRIQLTSIFLLLFAGLARAQQNNHEVITLYERSMNEAAKKWMLHDYAAALDEFDSAREILLYHVPLTSDDYSWNTFHSLKIYTVLLKRLVEVERYQNSEQAELAKKARKQAKDWVVDLNNQTKKWMDLKSPSPEDGKIRLKWIKRFHAVIQKVKTEF